MDPSSTPAEVKQQKQSGTRQFKPLRITVGLRTYFYEASRIALDSASVPKQMVAVKLSDADVNIIEQQNASSMQQVWNMAFEHYQTTRNNIIIEQLSLYKTIRNVRSLLLTAYSDTNNVTQASVVLGDVERWALYEAFKADAKLLEQLATAKTSAFVHPYCSPITHECVRRHSELLGSFSFRPSYCRRGPRSYLGLLFRYALHSRFGQTNFKLQGKLCYPAFIEWETDPFIEFFPDACNPDVNDERDARFEASLSVLPQELHDKAHTQWCAPTWEQLVCESELCYHFNRETWKESFMSGEGLVLMLQDNSPLTPMSTPAVFRRRPRTARSAASVASSSDSLPVSRPNIVQKPPSSFALAQSTPTPPPPPSPVVFVPQEPAQDAEAVLRGIFDSLEPSQGIP